MRSISASIILLALGVALPSAASAPLTAADVLAADEARRRFTAVVHRGDDGRLWLVSYQSTSLPTAEREAASDA